MNKTLPHAPPGWLDVLEESEAQVDAGLTAPGGVVRQDLLDGWARMKAKREQQPKRGASLRR